MAIGRESGYRGPGLLGKLMWLPASAGKAEDIVPIERRISVWFGLIFLFLAAWIQYAKYPYPPVRDSSGHVRRTAVILEGPYSASDDRQVLEVYLKFETGGGRQFRLQYPARYALIPDINMGKRLLVDVALSSMAKKRPKVIRVHRYAGKEIFSEDVLLELRWRDYRFFIHLRNIFLGFFVFCLLNYVYLGIKFKPPPEEGQG
ncbi:MAG: hypothetical protein Q4B17_00830 [Lautropia sp.]|nr:hypothetical protein [Lautropia sp.]